MTSRVSLLPPYPAGGVAAWYRADRIVLSNGVAGAWLDASGNGNDGKQTTIANRPSWVPTDVPAPSVLCTVDSADTAINSFIVASAASLNPGTGSVHLWTVIRTPASYPATHTMHGPLIDKNSSSPWTGSLADGYGLGLNISGGVAFPVAACAGVTGTISSAVSISNPAIHLLEYRYDGNSNHFLAIDGVETLIQTTATTTNTNGNTITMGSTNANVNRSFAGSIFEQGINIPAPPTAALITGRRTLGKKYGLTVP